MDPRTVEKQVILNGLLINYYITEPEQTGNTLVFLHGWRSEGAIWFEIMNQMAKNGFNCYALDLPGFGKSQASSKSYSLSNYCNIVIEFVNKLNLKNYTFIGHSFGGRISIKIAARYELENLKSIVLVDSAGIYHNSLSTKLIKVIANIVRPIFKPSFMQPLRRKIYSGLGASDYLETRYLKDTFVNIVEEDLEPLLPSIKIPTLIVWGKQDENEYTPVADAYIINKGIPNSKLEVIDNAKHYSFLDQKEVFLRKISEFLNS